MMGRIWSTYPRQIKTWTFLKHQRILQYVEKPDSDEQITKPIKRIRAKPACLDLVFSDIAKFLEV